MVTVSRFAAPGLSMIELRILTTRVGGMATQPSIAAVIMVSASALGSNWTCDAGGLAALP